MNKKHYSNWQGYWEKFLLTRYGKEEAQKEEDLYMQVGRTINKKPIEKEVFKEIVEKIITDLSFSSDDIIVDFCCGNGLFTYELKDKAKHIIAVDFSQNIIDTANKHKYAPNITYGLGDAVTYMKTFKEIWPGIIPDKYLMNDALAYFTTSDLREMLINIIAVSDNFKFLIRGVPNEHLKWNYYNTPERQQFYYDLQAKGDLTNDGLGNWWEPGDIEGVCKELKLKCIICNQELPISDYRMDIIITK